MLAFLEVNMNKQFYKEAAIVFGVFLGATVVIVGCAKSTELPVSSTKENYSLVVQEKTDMNQMSDKLNISQSLVTSVSDMNSQKLTFYVQSDGKIIQKSIVTNDDIEFVESNKNSIRYTKHSNLFGNEVKTDNVVINYDRNMFSIKK